MALTCDARLKETVTQLCSMRRAKYGRKPVGLKPGSISELLANNFDSDKQKAHDRRLTKEAEEKAKMAKKHLNKAVKFNIAVEEPLAKTSMEINQNLKAMDHKKGIRLAYLKRQFDARITRAEAEAYSYDSLPVRFRSAHTKKLVKNPQDDADPMAYLSDLLIAMINLDSKRTFSSDIQLSGLLRQTPVLDVDTTNPIATEGKKNGRVPCGPSRTSGRSLATAA
jgi:hypothetical protein